jgi:hypothetical protein
VAGHDRVGLPEADDARLDVRARWSLSSGFGSVAVSARCPSSKSWMTLRAARACTAGGAWSILQLAEGDGNGELDFCAVDCIAADGDSFGNSFP